MEHIEIRLGIVGSSEPPRCGCCYKRASQQTFAALWVRCLDCGEHTCPRCKQQGENRCYVCAKDRAEQAS